MGKNSDGDIAIDDISSTVGECKPEKICDFEADWCGFSSTSTPAWQRGQPNANTVDHTTLTNSGKFAFVDMTSAVINSGSYLETPAYQLPIGFQEAECAKFYYYLTGNDLARLNVYLSDLIGQSMKELVWSKNSHEHEDWRFAQATLNLNTSWVGYKLLFDAVKGTGSVGVVGIDDFSIDIGACEEYVNCDFEDGTLCTWVQADDNDEDWEVTQAAKEYMLSAPDVDHTTNSDEGWYIYVKSSYFPSNEARARLISDYIGILEESCFSFWYYIDDEESNGINVYRNDTNGGSTKLLGIDPGKYGPYWLKAEIPLKPNVEYRLIIESIVSSIFLFLLFLN